MCQVGLAHLRWAKGILTVSAQVCFEVLLVCRKDLPLDRDFRVLQAWGAGYAPTGDLHLLTQLSLPCIPLLFGRWRYGLKFLATRLDGQGWIEHVQVPIALLVGRFSINPSLLLRAGEACVHALGGQSRMAASDHHLLLLLRLLLS